MDGGALGLLWAVSVVMMGRTRRGGEEDTAGAGTGADAGDGMLRRRLPLFPTAAPARLPMVGLGLRLPKLPIGLANPLPKEELLAGEMTAIWSDWCSSSGPMPASMAAAESRTEGTEC